MRDPLPAGDWSAAARSTRSARSAKTAGTRGTASTQSCRSPPSMIPRTAGTATLREPSHKDLLAKILRLLAPLHLRVLGAARQVPSPEDPRSGLEPGPSSAAAPY
eukprot:CAMPEP_0170505032 /NCGR_PEP_ID=MMETSP0208-20121228/49627_1 /TAXON_ID=197538 /ORGANISM="Strombidium inclinatum, Strain S3" /LENGTH=104 /DNA_ID=CAMNT_0010785631 /DNA_START=1954 /DNA_END=2268 /DNA_ORIENTATION=-